MRLLVALLGLVPSLVVGDDRPVNRPAFYWSEDNAKMYLNVFWSPTLKGDKKDSDSLFGDSGFTKPMDEVEVFFDTQSLEVFAFNNDEGFHLELPLRNRIVVKWSTFEKREDGIDITLKKTRVGRWRSVQPLKGGHEIKKNAMAVKLEDQARYNVFDAIQNNELRNWLDTYPYHCLACNAIFDQVYKGDGSNRELWSFFKEKPPPPPKSQNKTTRAWKAYTDKIEAEFEFDYACDRLMSMRATTFGTSAIVGSDVDFACNLIVNNRTVQEAFINGYKYIQHAMHGAPETVHAWDGQPSLQKIVETAPDLIPEHRDHVCGIGAEACALVAHHSFSKCDACNSVILLTDGILAYPRGDYPRDREEVEELVQNDLCGFPVKSRIGDNAVVAEVCEELLDEYENEIINTLTYKQKPAENIKLNPSSVPPAVSDFCGQQTHFCDRPKRIPVKKFEPYELTVEMLEKIVQEVEDEAKAEEKKKKKEENKEFKDFDILHAKAVEGRTWVNDLPEDMQFPEDIHETRKERFEQFQKEL